MRGVADEVQGDERKQEVAEAGRRWPGRVAARAGRVPVLLAEEEGDRGGAGGLGRPGGELGRLVAPGKWPRWPSLSYFCSVLFFSISAICF